MRTLAPALLVAAALLATGCGKSIADRARGAANKAGQVVGEGAGNFFSGVGEGVERAVTTYDVRVADALKASGIAVTIAKHVDGVGTNGSTLSFYILNKLAFAGTLRIKLFNAADQEIGRSTAEVAFPPDDARYVAFPLDREIPLSVARYVVLETRDPETKP